MLTSIASRRSSDAVPETVQYDNLKFPAIGVALPPPAAHGKDEVLANIQYLQDELKRWERSIAFVHESSLPGVTESVRSASLQFTHTKQLISCGLKETLHDMLDILRSQLTDSNASSAQQTLANLLDPLQPWTGSIIRTESVHEELYLAVSHALLNLTQFLIDTIGLERLLPDNKEYVEACNDMARAFIEGHEATKLLLGQDGMDPNDADRLRTRNKVKAITKAVRSRMILNRMESPPRFG